MMVVKQHYQNQMELGKHSDCQRSPKARASLSARSCVQSFWDLSLQWLSQVYSLLASPPSLYFGNLPWVRLNSFTASRIASHWVSSLEFAEFLIWWPGWKPPVPR